MGFLPSERFEQLLAARSRLARFEIPDYINSG